MTPLLTGVFASQISGHLTPPFTSTGSYEALASYTVPSGGTSGITLSGFPINGKYSHLQVRYWLPSTPTAGDSIYIQLGNNGIDGGGNYSYHGLYGYNGTNVIGATGLANSTRIETHYSAQTGSVDAPFSGVIDILDYASSTKYKTTRSLSGHQFNSNATTGYSTMWLVSGNWRNSNPITSLKLAFGGGNLPQYTKVSIYGIKG
jgi:hypothetical protein